MIKTWLGSWVMPWVLLWCFTASANTPIVDIFDARHLSATVNPTAVTDEKTTTQPNQAPVLINPPMAVMIGFAKNEAGEQWAVLTSDNGEQKIVQQGDFINQTLYITAIDEHMVGLSDGTQLNMMR